MTPRLKAYAEKYNVPVSELEKFWVSAKEEYDENWEKVFGAVKKMCQNYKKGMNESLNAKIKIGQKRAIDMMNAMYPKSKNYWEGTEVLNFKLGKELVGQWENGTLYYQFKKSDKNESNFSKILNILSSEK